MRTTIDLPPDLHDLARQLAHETNSTMSHIIERLIRRGLEPSSQVPEASPSGMPLVRIGRPVTAKDVRSLDDE